MTFEDWWEENKDRLYMLGTSEIVRQAWQAAQQAEKKRILKIVEQVGIQGNHNSWFDCCDTIVAKIKNELDT